MGWRLIWPYDEDYGRTDVAQSLTTTSEDLFGPTMNICAKTNSIAMPNSMVIGGGLYKIVKRTFDKNYYFSKVGAYSIGDLNIQYPVYSTSNKSKNSNADTLSLYKNILWIKAKHFLRCLWMCTSSMFVAMRI